MSNNKINKRSLSVPVIQFDSEIEPAILPKTRQFRLDMIRYIVEIDNLMEKYVKEVETFYNARNKNYGDDVIDVDDSDSSDSFKQEFSRRRKSKKVMKRNVHSYNNEEFLMN